MGESPSIVNNEADGTPKEPDFSAPEAVWPAYSERGTGTHATPAPSRRWKGLLPVAALAVAATLLRRAYGWTLGVEALYALAALVFLAGLAFPGVLERAAQLGELLGRAVGTGLTWALLTPLYLLVFAPARLALALTGRDPLRRRFPSDAPTYWIAPVPPGAGRDRRQF